MGWLFLVALLFAIPTFGLSLVIWFVILVFRARSEAKGRIERIDYRREVVQKIEPLFQGRFDEYFDALDVPTHPGTEVSADDAYACGRHIMNYIAQNPEETLEFLQGVEMGELDLFAALDMEEANGRKGPIHRVSYRAIEAVMTNNKHLKCFENVELGSVLARLLVAGIGQRLSRTG